MPDQLVVTARPRGRRAILPATAGVGAAVAGAAVWCSGLAWPILTTVWSIVAPRADTAYSEDDPVG